MGIQKTAVDAIAEKYWSQYFPNRYGDLLTRKIKVKMKRGASLEEPVTIAPIAHVELKDGGLSMEGIAAYADGQQTAFSVRFNQDLEAVALSTHGVK